MENAARVTMDSQPGVCYMNFGLRECVVAEGRLSRGAPRCYLKN